jgi:hypothetical protein
MENVIVKFPEQRTVLIDGEESGETNTILRVEAGTHTFKLGDPADYTPSWRRKKVAGTSPVKPMEVAFEKM